MAMQTRMLSATLASLNVVGLKFSVVTDLREVALSSGLNQQYVGRAIFASNFRFDDDE
jgi:hypothetical protein